MGLLDVSRKTFISRLQHTAVKSGTYIVMPNAEKPAFLVPAYSWRAFRQGIDLIKPITRTGELKKALIKLIPLPLLKLKFPTMKIENSNAGDRDVVILPWNQNPISKITMILYDKKLTNVEVEKYAFFPETQEMLHNERSFLNKLKGDEKAKIIVPEVKDFRETTDYVCLVQNFYFGSYVETISSNILAFFAKLNSDEIRSLDEHPYIIEKMPSILGMLKSHDCLDLLTEVEKLYSEYRKTKFQIATMHSDFSTTNTVHTKDDQFVIIDWEDADENGINIDVPFFKFRRHLYDHGSWKINNAESFLVVLHYIWFMVSKRNVDMLKQFSINQNVFTA